jgi:type IV secretory pathway TraG/TraD family ATPase VirD4
MAGYILGRNGSSSRDFGFTSRVQHNAGDLITYSGESHLITFAPTGAGKTAGPVITNSLLEVAFYQCRGHGTFPL